MHRPTRLSLAILLVAAAACHSKGATEIPAVPGHPGARFAGERFDAWLASFNSADAGAVRAFRESSYAIDVSGTGVHPIDDEIDFRRETGGFDLAKKESQTATRVSMIVKERDSDQFARAIIEIDAIPPYRIRRFDLAAIPTPAELLPVRLSEGDALSAFRLQIERRVKADEFSGAVLIAKDGIPIFQQAYGLADREKRISNTLDTRFRLGSMNKMFTATATLQLVQVGKIRLQNTLADLVPDYPNKKYSSKVSIEQLLTHTAGTGDIFGPAFEEKRAALRTLNDYVNLYAARDLSFEPGAKYEYSNYGYLILGIVIEHVTGQSYYAWVKDHVFKPAGMLDSDSPPEDQLDPKRCIAYTRETQASPWIPAAPWLPYRGTSAGGGTSTVGDLLRFANALFGNKLLDAEHTRMLTTGRVEQPQGGHYAYGFTDEIVGGVRCVGHTGGAGGMNGALSICDSGYTIAILANLDPPSADRLARFIELRLPSGSPP